jgi:two-component system, NarL family, sensor histidine kinase UhpB
MKKLTDPIKRSILFLVTYCSALTSSSQQMNVDSLLNKLSVLKEDTAKATVYENLALTFRFTEPGKAIEYGKQGIVLSRKLSFDKGIAGCCLRVSTAYAYSGKLDTAFLYLDTALVYMQKVGDLNRLGLIYLNRADFYRQKMNMKQALLDCDTALRYADKANNDDVRARVNQTMGSIYFRQQNYSQGISYAEKAVVLYRKTGNMRMSSAGLNNLGLIYKEMKEYDKAITSMQQAIRIIDSLKDITNLSVYYGNLCTVYFQTNEYDKAAKYADKAMEYAVMQDNSAEIAMAQQLKATIMIHHKKYAEAIAYMDKALPVFQEIEDMDNISIGADIMAEAFAGLGDHASAYEYIKIAREAGDSLVKWKYDDDIAAMQTKFKVDEKDKEIQLLAKDKELQQQKLQRRTLLLTGAAVIALLALAGIWLLMNRNKLRQRMKELEIRNQIASDLHDEVGSSLSSIHMLSQMATQQGSDTKQNDVLQKMSSNAKETMDKMGDIVWMIKPGESEASSLKQRMERFAYEICSSKNIATSVNIDELEKVKLTMEQRKNIYLVFKEALNNAVKYSGTERTDVSITAHNKELVLQVKDHGKGFDTTVDGKGNGLENMKNRAAELKGKLLVDSNRGTGTTITMTVPL